MEQDRKGRASNEVRVEKEGGLCEFFLMSGFSNSIRSGFCAWSPATVGAQLPCRDSGVGELTWEKRSPGRLGSSVRQSLGREMLFVNIAAHTRSVGSVCTA